MSQSSPFIHPFCNGVTRVGIIWCSNLYNPQELGIEVDFSSLEKSLQK